MLFFFLKKRVVFSEGSLSTRNLLGHLHNFFVPQRARQCCSGQEGEVGPTHSETTRSSFWSFFPDTGSAASLNDWGLLQSDMNTCRGDCCVCPRSSAQSSQLWLLPLSSAITAQPVGSLITSSCTLPRGHASFSPHHLLLAHTHPFLLSWHPGLSNSHLAFDQPSPARDVIQPKYIL